MMPVEYTPFDPTRHDKFHQRNRPRSKYDWKKLKEYHPKCFEFWKKKLNKPENFFA